MRIGRPQQVLSVDRPSANEGVSALPSAEELVAEEATR